MFIVRGLLFELFRGILFNIKSMALNRWKAILSFINYFKGKKKKGKRR